MANKLINTDKLTAIADAIRGKTGSTDTYSVDGMVDAIANISVGGGGDTSMEDGLVDGTLTAYSNPRVAKIRDYAFYGCTSLTTANFPLVTTIGSSAFQNCRGLTTVNFPLVTTIRGYTFYSCTGLTTANFPLVTTIGSYAFYDCRGLTTANFPLVTTIGTSAFYGGYRLTALILRNTTQVCTLISINVFDSCYHYHGTVNATYNPDGLKDGYIYVPASLINSYKAATNWSTFATQFRALEDYTVDGTTTGELDENKI